MEKKAVLSRLCSSSVCRAVEEYQPLHGFAAAEYQQEQQYEEDRRWKGGGAKGGLVSTVADVSDGWHLCAMELVTGCRPSDQMLHSSAVASKWYTQQGLLKPIFQLPSFITSSSKDPTHKHQQQQQQGQGQQRGDGSKGGSWWGYNSSDRQGVLPLCPLVVLLEQGQGLGGQQGQEQRTNRRLPGKGYLPREQAEELAAFVGCMLVVDPTRRCTAKQLLLHPYLQGVAAAAAAAQSVEIDSR